MGETRTAVILGGEEVSDGSTRMKPGAWICAALGGHAGVGARVRAELGGVSESWVMGASGSGDSRDSDQRGLLPPCPSLAGGSHCGSQSTSVRLCKTGTVYPAHS